MYASIVHAKQKPVSTQISEFLLLDSEPRLADSPSRVHAGFRPRNRYLAKRRVMRTIRRLQRERSR